MELLTGKAKYKFIEYLQNKKDNGKYLGIYLMVSKYNIECQITILWGVIEDFAESEGYYICFYFHSINDYGFTIEYVDLTILFDGLDFKTRNEARKECIKELNNLINK